MTKTVLFYLIWQKLVFYFQNDIPDSQTALFPCKNIVYLTCYDQNSTDFFSFINYADDTTLINTSNNPDPTEININLNKVYDWLCINKLSLNKQKTKFILFHGKNKHIEDKIPLIMLKDVIITRVKDFNFLGVTLNQNLNWDTYICSLCSKTSRCIGILSELKAYFPISIMKILYHSLIISKFTYGLLACKGI